MLFDFKFEGNLAADPEFKFTPTGKAVAKLRVAHNTRRRTSEGWVDGTPMWVTVTAWEDLAERVAELRKGDTVIVEARDDLSIWSFINQDTQKAGGQLQVTAANIALSLRFKGATTVAAKATTASEGVWDAEFAQELEPAM